MSYHQWPTNKFIRTFVLTIIMCVTLIGNCYIIFELFCRRRRHRTRLHLFILNLAIGDLAICLFTMTSELFLLIFDQEWILGNIACKLTLYIQVVTVASTTFINVAMTYDRYEAICCPFRSCTALHRVRRIITLCWLSSLIVAIPQLFIFKQSSIPNNSEKYRCSSTGYTAEWQRRVYFTIFASYLLVIPAFCMIIWYVKMIRVVGSSTKRWMQKTNNQTSTVLTSTVASPAKFKTVKLAMTIIIVFVACWTPYIFITLIEIYTNRYVRVPPWLDGVLQTICFAQSGLNPFVYIIFNRRSKSLPTVIITSIKTDSPTIRSQGLQYESTSSYGTARTPLRLNSYRS
ncbi:unnamed protein product [Rotaria magnacalcarata]|uniref:G-protein coupled receptors family 1 profile domain-containing protein n=3 Tax=Rotaria magnacalcarata TaxID=392030 RepID=A0A816SPL2_9BILA|nr:unnamed protein product [Rotaria magnacalcarata]CAF1529504.1 unnamed protein product [Rotaria magnacalcarata]CAF2091101.1 unnamed protein product [Rotaria magnacalcarata]